MHKKTILITGANKGIGFEIARQLAAKGHLVIISGRSKIRLEEAADRLREENEGIESILMDVSDDSSVTDAAEELKGRSIGLDVLINNAAILYKEDKSLEKMNFVLLENIINTNSYGPLRVIRAMLPIIKNGGRIINISSEGGSMTEPIGGWSPGYCTSKSFLNALTRHLAYELSGRNISVNAVTPGWVRTEMGGTYAPRPIIKGAETPVWLASDAPHELTGKFFKDKSEIRW